MKRAGLVGLSVLALACATFETRGDRSYEGARTYSGARTSLDRIGAGMLSLNPATILLGVLDLPFSFLADTALLPVTIPEESARQREIAERTQTQHEVATEIRSDPGVAPVETARRLFESCTTRLENLDAALANCYSIDARIVLVEAEDPGGPAVELSGGEYKERIREVLARTRTSGDFLTYRDASYEAEGPNVRVRAQRASSASPNPWPVTFLLGPGDDGEWRILEERGPDWP
ncbi:MAG: YceK/YidQ family lipoprotein [Myxococcota bacterium]